MLCHKCGFANDADAEFCENCGASLAHACANCGTVLKPGAKFCKKCGTPVGGTSAVSPAPPAAAIRSADRLSALRKSAPRALKDKILATRDRIEGERKPVTILFADIVGSTPLAEKLDPEEWKEIVDGAHRRVGEAVYRYEGTIAQLLGDGVLAFFGAPVTHEDDPVRAVRAALDIQQAIAEYARELHGYVQDFQMRVGVNSGTVVVGTVGSDMHMEYLAIGDAVNLAARLQSAAQPGRVLISESTARFCRTVFELNPLSDLAVKGKAEPVKVFEVVTPKAAPSTGRGIEGLTSALVGRDRELSILTDALERLTEGHGQIVTVLGEAGIGKSRLVEEAHLRLTGAPSALNWLEGRALSYGQTLSFWMLGQLIRNDLGLSDGDPEAKIKVALRRRLAELFGEQSDEVSPYLAHLLGIKLEGEEGRRVQVLDGETLKRQTILSLVEYFGRVARDRPAVLVFEDLHWADPSTLDVLERLLGLTDRAPLMVLMLMRMERDHAAWQIKLAAETNYEHRYTELYLKALSPQDSNQLVNQLLEVADLPASIRQLILDRSEGNPFYLEEIIRGLIEQGAVVHEGRTWRATEQILQVTIPDTLQGVLLARIDRLQEDVRRTLQMASVIGKSFLFRLLEMIAEAERQLDEHLAQLQRADLVREKARIPELEYIFKHSLTQEAAYNSLLIERRKEFHRKVGEALEQLFSGRREEFLGLLAHHFDAAGERAKAIEYWIQAGDKDRLADSHAEALQSYRRAIELLNEAGDLERAAKTWLKLGLIYQANFEFDRAHEANETAFDLERRARGREPRPRRDHPREEAPRVFRLGYTGSQLATLDPARITFSSETWVTSHLFVGLAEFDSETNVVPNAARSWEVLDGGTRYVFHLRDDMRWTDGAPLTAGEFEWTWKHNLAPDAGSAYGGLLDDIRGARDYRQRRNPDPDSVGVRALDPFTLEVRLIAPVAYFIYLVTLPITYPLPRSAVERYGEDWWKPEHIISNGPFRLVEFDAAHERMVRNPDYFGEFSGNLEEFQAYVLDSYATVLSEYSSERIDTAVDLPRREIPAGVPDGERVIYRGLATAAVTLIPTGPPLDDVRVRRAIAHALDRSKLFEASLGKRVTWNGGGIIPPGMAGHSPEIGLGLNVERAQQLLAEAGYPGGRNLRVLKYHYPASQDQSVVDAFKRQMLDGLGIRIEAVPMSWDKPWWTVEGSDMQSGPWIGDYPDPDNFLRQSSFYLTLQKRGWRHPHFEELVETAARTPDRARRLAMYREADRILVDEQVVVVPVFHFPDLSAELLKPWVKGYKQNALGFYSMKDLVIEPH
jgi:ABC-type oligopeptide transport system substrate-binding subunit/class 3 adenylate cyclase